MVFHTKTKTVSNNVLQITHISSFVPEVLQTKIITARAREGQSGGMKEREGKGGYEHGSWTHKDARCRGAVTQQQPTSTCKEK